jgi:photosystem II stability/assembly factor-like uncharacterized protein
MMIQRRWTALGALALVCGIVPLTTPATAAKACGTPPVKVASPGWTIVPSPPYPADADPVRTQVRNSLGGTQTVLAADPTVAGRVLATDGVTLMESVDAGCTWRKQWSLLDSTDNALYGGRIARVLLSASPGKSAVIYLQLVVDRGLALLRSDDRGATFVRADGGLPAAASTQPEDSLTVAPGNPNILYIVFGMAGGLWGSDDGGRTWAQRYAFEPVGWYTYVAGVPGTNARSDYYRFKCCAVDPAAPHDIWAWNTDNVKHSTDGGKTFSNVVALKDGLVGNELFVTHPKGRAASIVFQRGDDLTMWGSGDGGKRFRTLFGGFAVSWGLIRCTSVCTDTDAVALVAPNFRAGGQLIRLRGSFRKGEDLSGGWYERMLSMTSTTIQGHTTVYTAETDYLDASRPAVIERRTFSNF